MKHALFDATIVKIDQAVRLAGQRSETSGFQHPFPFKRWAA